jgi:multiple sugar transport system substrate-binding protein
VKTAGKKGITFSAIGTEEGSFQFLPWFWGAGAQLTQLDSPQATAALDLWVS